MALLKRLWILGGLLALGCNGTVGSTTPDVDDSDGGAGAEDAAVPTDAARPQDAAVRVEDAAPARDAAQDSGTRDAATQDAAAQDAGAPDAGEPPASGDSEGCGMAATGEGTFVAQTVRINNTERTYHVRLPNDYDATRAYPVIFRFHGYGGNGLSGGLGIEGPAGDDAIIVAPDGLNMGWSNGSEAADLALFDAMYESVNARYCVDLARVFSYGFSMGGGFNNLLGCRRADKLRATAAIAGFDRGTGTCARPVAAWFQHDRNDDAVPIAQGTGARDRVLQRAQCSTNTTPAGSCVSYTGCNADYPVVWCETTGRGHNIAGDTAPPAVWEFFRTLP